MAWTPELTKQEKSASRRSSLRPDLARAQTQLDKLPPGAVILDRNGHAWQHDRIYWYRAYGDDTCVSSFELAQILEGTFTVIHPAKEDT